MKWHIGSAMKPRSKWRPWVYELLRFGFNFSKTEAIFYFDRHGGGGGGGGYILARKVDGVWRVVDDHASWMF